MLSVANVIKIKLVLLIRYGHLLKIKINPDIKIKDYDKFRFNSDIDLPVKTIIEFCSLLINVSCVIEKDNEYYPEIYLDDCSYVKNSIY